MRSCTRGNDFQNAGLKEQVYWENSRCGSCRASSPGVVQGGFYVIFNDAQRYYARREKLTLK